MGRTNRDSRTPLVKPIEKIELDEKHFNVRLFLAIALLVVGLIFIANAVIGVLSSKAGWKEFELTGDTVGYGDRFSFMYCLGTDGRNPTSENRQLSKTYNALANTAFQLFNCDKWYEDVHNLYYINHNVGSEVKVDPALYSAFELLEQYNSRALYLAPVYTNYYCLFGSENDYVAADYDPYMGEEAREYIAEAMKFVLDENAVNLELLGDCRVKLNVSDEYAAFMRDYELTVYLDFGWMQNAFIIDYIADGLIECDYTAGVINSCDGSIRCLDADKAKYAFNLYDLYDRKVYNVASLDYSGRKSCVYMHSFPLNSLDGYNYYLTENGEIRVPYVDVSDGLTRASVSSFAAFSEEFGCAELMMRMIPFYVADTADTTLLSALGSDVKYFYVDGRAIHLNGDPDVLYNVYNTEKLKYEVCKD